MSETLSRRAALGAFASVPALALPAAAAALTTPPSPTLAALIEAHVAAKAAFYVEIDALEAAWPDRKTMIKCVGPNHAEIGCSRPDEVVNRVDRIFDREAEKFSTLAVLAPEIAEAALARLEQERAAAHARVEEVFADYRAAEARYSAASEAEEDALTAICAYRCATFDELAEKGRFLSRHCERDELTPEQYDALLASMFEELEAI